MKVILPRYTVELQPPSLPVRQGTVGVNVKRVQEWLTLNGNTVAVDSDYGPGTAMGVHLFKQKMQVGAAPYDGSSVDLATWNALVAPLVRANVVDVKGTDFGENVVRVAKRYHAEHAREAGGDNRGPWERHLSRGRENQPWCQDAASTWWMDAARNLRLTATPFDLVDDATGLASSYVPWVAWMANKNKMLQRGADRMLVPPGSMFFVRGHDPEIPYIHVGVVVEDGGDHLITLEGNTNDGGSSNGFNVSERSRVRSTMDFGRCK